MRQQIIYLEVLQNRVLITDCESEQHFEVLGDFSNQRLAIAHFAACEAKLSQAIGQIKRKSILHTFTFVMHQQAHNEGGLCEVEERILMELGSGLGARKVIVWQGQPLSLEALKQRKFETKG